jgi:hypothetical protein
MEQGEKSEEHRAEDRRQMTDNSRVTSVQGQGLCQINHYHNLNLKTSSSLDVRRHCLREVRYL